MSELLKGNFKVRNPVAAEERRPPESLAETQRKRALASIGGSMVYVERTPLNWDGDGDGRKTG